MYYTSKEVAKLCNVSIMSVSRWQRAGLITPVHKNKKFNLFLKVDIDLFISKRKK
jgi:DNA-binding transcriptional MerR regulator